MVLAGGAALPAAASAQEEEPGEPLARSLRDERDHRAADRGVIATDGEHSRDAIEPRDRNATVSRLAAAGGRLLQPSDAEAEPVEAGGIRRAIASLRPRPTAPSRCAEWSGAADRDRASPWPDRVRRVASVDHGIGPPREQQSGHRRSRRSAIGAGRLRPPNGSAGAWLPTVATGSAGCPRPSAHEAEHELCYK